MANKNKKIAAIYVRVSTDSQAEEGYSIDAQKEQLTAYCISKGIKDYEYYIDAGWSGSNIERPEIQRLIKDIQSDKISHVLVFKLDRLSRSQKDTWYLMEDVFAPHNVDFISLNESMDTSTPLGKLMLGILSAFAQLERENISFRTKTGMKERVKNGYWMGGGRVPFGYDYDRNLGILVKNNDSDTVKKIYDLYIQGLSTQAITDILRLKYDRLVIQVLKRKCNYGVIEYKGEEYKGLHEPIISKDIYDMAMMEMNRRKVNNIKKSTHLLTGLVYCGKCGAKMRYIPWGKNKYKFMCYSQQKSKQYLIKNPDCNQERIWADDIESIVLEKIFYLKETETSEKSCDVFLTNALDELIKNKKLTEQKIKRLYNLYSESEDDMLLDIIQENQSDLKRIEKQIKEQENELLKQSTIIKNKDILKTLKGKWEYMTENEKRSIVRILVQRIEICDNVVNITLNI